MIVNKVNPGFYLNLVDCYLSHPLCPPSPNATLQQTIDIFFGEGEEYLRGAGAPLADILPFCS